MSTKNHNPQEKRASTDIVTHRQIMYLLITVSLLTSITSGCAPSASSPHGTMMGHWKKVEEAASGDARNWTYSVSDTDEYHQYISRSRKSRVDSNGKRSRTKYKVLSQDPDDFSLDISCTTPGGGTSTSHVTFSEDKKLMYEKTRYAASRLPGGSVALTITYMRVDDRTRP